MKFSLPLIVIASLVVAGCGKAPATTGQTDTQSTKQMPTPPKKREIRPETESYLFNSNKLVCIGGALYFAGWDEGGVVIRSPVMDPKSPNNAVICEGGFRLEQFGKLY